MSLSGEAPSLLRWLVRDFAAVLPALSCWLLLRALGFSDGTALPWTVGAFLLSFGSAVPNGFGFQGWVSGTRRVASHQPFGDRPEQMNRYETLRDALPDSTPITEADWRRWELQVAARLPPLVRLMTYGPQGLAPAFAKMALAVASLLVMTGASVWVSLKVAPSPGIGLAASLAVALLTGLGIWFARGRQGP